MGCADQLPRRDGRLSCPICRAECIYAPVQGSPLAEEYEAEAALAQLRVEEAELQTRIQDVQGVINAAQEHRAAEARSASVQRLLQQLPTRLAGSSSNGNRSGSDRHSCSANAQAEAPKRSTHSFRTQRKRLINRSAA